MTELVLDLSYLHFVEEQWWRTPGPMRAILECVAQAGLGIEYRFLNDRKVRSLQKLYDGCTSWSAGGSALTSQPQSDDPDTQLHVMPLRHKKRLLLAIKWSILPADGLEKLVQLVVNLHNALGPDVRFGQDLCIRPIGDYQLPEPARQPLGWTLGTLVDFASRRFFERDEEPENLARLLAAPLPPGATLRDFGDLLAFCFTDNLQGDLGEACRRQYLWRADALQLPPA